VQKAAELISAADVATGRLLDPYRFGWQKREPAVRAFSVVGR
jgi:hypothetical protein